MKKLITVIAVNIIFFSTITYAGVYNIEKQNERIAAMQATEDINKAIQCLALNIYFETHAISMADAMAVSDVVMNRVEHSYYPNEVCAVIQQGYKKGSNVCQFSWYCDGKADNPTNHEAWERSRKYARDFYVHGLYVGITEGSTHYHAHYVKPYWAPTLDRVTRIGSHIFYRMK